MKKNGFTLIELLASLSIVSILAFIGLPNLNDFLRKQNLSSTTRLLMQNITMAREYAITNQVYASICPTDDQITCSKSWNKDLLVFVDGNRDGVYDSQETLLRYTEVNANWNVKWKAFGNHTSLTFTPKGFTKAQNGTFNICSTSYKNKMGRTVILNKAGRSRVGQDKNNNGLSEKSNGKDMTC